MLKINICSWLVKMVRFDSENGDSVMQLSVEDMVRLDSENGNNIMLLGVED